MKSAGKVYNSKMLKYLMMKIATRNSIHYKNDNKENLFVSKFETFQECMQNIDNFSHVPTNFYEFIERLDKLTNVYSVQINIDELQTSKEYMQIRSFLYEAITQNFEKVNSFMTEHSDSSADDTSDLKDFLYQLTAFDKSSYNTKTINGVHIDKNYMVNVVEYIKNTSREFATVFPNKICNKTKIFYGTGSKVDPYVFPRSKTWDFSGFHLGDLKKAFSEYSKYLEVFYTQNDDGINFNTIMKEFSLKVETIRIFIENTPLLFAGMKNDELQISVFYEDTLFMIYTFYFSELLNLIIDVSESTIVDENENDRLKLLMKTAKYILETCNTFMNNKKKINLSYESITNKILLSKEREKARMRTRLEKMSEDQLEVEREKKRYKLGIWGKGLQRGHFTYDKGAYNMERNELI
jgi:hypothetical protein